MLHCGHELTLHSSHSCWLRITTYKADIPALYSYNVYAVYRDLKYFYLRISSQVLSTGSDIPVESQTRALEHQKSKDS